MKTKFEEVANLYIGCKCAFYNELTDKGIPTLTGLLKYPYMGVLYSLDTEEYHHEVDISDFKPILRPLSDMSKDELEKIVEIGEVNHRGESPENFVIGWKAYTPNTFAYLLSRSFDLFGLIESGEALDKTKL